jgi:hypothetical protein
MDDFYGMLEPDSEVSPKSRQSVAEPSPAEQFPGLKAQKEQGVVLEFCATGSRVICNPPPLNTDEDWVVLVLSTKDYERQMIRYGFKVDGSKVEDAFHEKRIDGFRSLKKGDLNIIITKSRDFYSRFVAATRVAKRLNLTKKSDRVALFQAVLYGNS